MVASIFEEEDNVVDPEEPDASWLDVDKFPTADVYDQYLTALIVMEPDDEQMRETVKRRAKDGNDRPVGPHNRNPLLDTRECESSSMRVWSIFCRLIRLQKRSIHQSMKKADLKSY